MPLREERGGAPSRPSVAASIHRAVLNVDVAAARELDALSRSQLAKRARGTAGPDPAGLDDRSGFDPCACRNASTRLHGDVVFDTRHHADEAVFAERAAAHLHVVANRDAGAKDELAASTAREQERV